MDGHRDGELEVELLACLGPDWSELTMQDFPSLSLYLGVLTDRHKMRHCQIVANQPTVNTSAIEHAFSSEVSV
jgi:hypothetical protein